MTTYYISYGDSPGRRFTRGIMLAGIGALLLAGVIAYIVWALFADHSEAATESDAPRVGAVAEPAAPFTEAIPAAYASDTNTIFVVDVSGSIEEAGYIEEVKFALSSLALPDSEVAVENSRAGLMIFGGDGEAQSVIALAPLEDEAAQLKWLVEVDAMQATTDGGSFIYDAVDSARRNLTESPDDGRRNVIVLISDGIDGGVGECQPIPPDYDTGQTAYCAADSGDPVPCDKTNGGAVRINQICEHIFSSVNPSVLLDSLGKDGFTVNVIAYGSPQDHTWLKLAAGYTDGTYKLGGE